MVAILVDASGFLYRGYHVQPKIELPDGSFIKRTLSDGVTHTGCILGFVEMMWRLIKRTEETSTHFGVVFDAGKSKSRTALFPEYKAQRKPPEADLIQQIPMLRDATRAFGLEVIESPGIEADDLLVSYAKALNAEGILTTLVTSDKDLMQAIAPPHVSMWCPLKKREITESDVLEKFGCRPKRVPDVQALVGDTTDNIPGVRGIGDKYAKALIGTFGTLDNILANIGHPDMKPALANKLRNGVDMALLSRKLATLDPNVPLPVPIQDITARAVSVSSLIAYAKAMEFDAFAAEVAEHYRVGL